MNNGRITFYAALAAAAAAMACSSALQGPVESIRDQAGLAAPAYSTHMKAAPQVAILQVAPGGIRAPCINYLWIRSQQLKEDGKFYDAKQLRELICDLQPYSSGVASYHAWDMAWNISVATHTPQERWMWVTNGLKLLRDRAIPIAPRDIVAYRQLAYLFANKMGESMDEMHVYYKQQWAMEMDRLLGSPPASDAAGEAVAAFAPVADAPADLPALRKDQAAADYLDRLAQLGVEPDEAFIQLYNQYAGDELAGNYDRQLAAEQPAAKPLIELVSDPKLSAVRSKLLAFARRRVLAQTYKMDAGWMLKLMQRYGPIDWRNVQSHALYWGTWGLFACKGLDLEHIQPGLADRDFTEAELKKLSLNDMQELNTERGVIQALKSLSRTGQTYLFYLPNPSDAAQPIMQLNWGPDIRFIEACDREYMSGGLAMVNNDRALLGTGANLLRDAHVVFLTTAIQFLYISGQEQLAQRYLDEVRNSLGGIDKDPRFKLPLAEFVRQTLTAEGVPTGEISQIFWYGALVRVYRALADGDMAGYRRYRDWAVNIYNAFLVDIGKAQRQQPPPFELVESNFLRTLLLHPRAVGMRVPLLAKIKIYTGVPPALQQQIYLTIADTMKAECQRDGLDFNKAFPSPFPQKPAR
jgi:hypothetical protein